MLASYTIQVFLHTMIILCCYVSGDTWSYDSRATQILELGVSEFCSTIPNSHVGVSIRVSVSGSCRVEVGVFD